MTCAKCNMEIDSDRAEFLSDTGRPHLCVKCTSESPLLTLMEYSHKTAPSLVVVPHGSEDRALRAFKRSR